MEYDKNMEYDKWNMTIDLISFAFPLFDLNCMCYPSLYAFQLKPGLPGMQSDAIFSFFITVNRRQILR